MRGYTPRSVQDAFRLVLLYCVNTYRGDEKLKSFIWELITPPEHAAAAQAAKTNEVSNASNGRNGSSGKGKKKGSNPPPVNDDPMSVYDFPEAIEWISDPKYDMETNLEKNYRKHLDRHNNRILLRIKTMHFISHEIVGKANAVKLRKPDTQLS